MYLGRTNSYSIAGAVSYCQLLLSTVGHARKVEAEGRCLSGDGLVHVSVVDRRGNSPYLDNSVPHPLFILIKQSGGGRDKSISQER